MIFIHPEAILGVYDIRLSDKYNQTHLIPPVTIVTASFFLFLECCYWLWARNSTFKNRLSWL